MIGRTNLVKFFGLLGLLLVVMLPAFNTMPAQARLQSAPVDNSSFAQAPYKVGEHLPADIQIRYDTPSTWEHTISHPDSAYIKIRFDEMNLYPGDRIVVQDLTGDQQRFYPGDSFTTDEESGFWAITVVSDRVLIRLERNAGATDDPRLNLYQSANNGVPVAQLGAHINKYARGYSEAELAANAGNTRSTCGNLDRTDVACYQATYPTEFNNAYAVARILQNGSSHCTGWRVTPDNFLMTNEHCITSQGQLNNMEFWFDYQRSQCQTGSPNTPTIVTGDQFLVDHVTYDFALLTLDNFASIQNFGYFDLDVRTPVLGEEIYIPQHGAGNPKEFGIESDVEPPDNLCRVVIPVTDGRGNDTDTGYFCDTIGGSSGSPVVARSSHQVIAIHHFGNAGAPNCTVAGNNVNRGVLMTLIFPIIDPFLGPAVYDATLANSSEVGLPGTTVQHALTLENLAANDSYNLSLQAGSWSSTLQTGSLLAVNGGSTADVLVDVEIPHLFTLHGTDVFTLTATSVNSPTLVLQATGTTDSVTNPSVVVSPNSATVTVNSPAYPGLQAEHIFNVRNAGNYTDTYTLSIAGNSWAVSGIPSSLTLAPGANRFVSAYVSIPVSPTVNTDTFTMTAVSGLDGTVQQSYAGTTVFNEVAVTPLTISGDLIGYGAYGQVITYSLHITNTEPAISEFSVQFSAHDWTTTASPMNFTLASGQSTTVEVYVTVGEGDNDLVDVTFIGTDVSAFMGAVQLDSRTNRIFLPILRTE